MIYSLKVLAGDRLAQKGTVVKGDCAPLTVGQCSDADVKITNDSPWEDANCFVVLKNDGFEGWHLARISRNVDLKVNGIPVDRIKRLIFAVPIIFSFAFCSVIRYPVSPLLFPFPE